MSEPVSKLLFAEHTFAIQGAIYEVNRVMGPGFLEGVYQECLAIEFAERGIPFVAQPQVKLAYKSRPLKQFYAADFVCFVELKAVRELAAEHRAQVLNYLSCTGYKVGLLVNFGQVGKAQVVRLALSSGEGAERLASF